MSSALSWLVATSVAAGLGATLPRGQAPSPGEQIGQDVGSALDAYGRQSPTRAEALPEGSLPAPNGLYVEAGGNGIIDSVNYERRFKAPPGGWQLGLRAGVGAFKWYSLFDASNVFVSVPVAMNLTRGEGDHHLELSLGLTPVFALSPAVGASAAEPRSVPGGPFALPGVMTAGYRYASPRGGLLLRAAIGALMFILHDSRLPDLAPTAGVSVGYAF